MHSSIPLPTDSNELRAVLRTILRDKGAVIDPPAMKALYAPLQNKAQEACASGLEITPCEREIAYGSHARHRLDIYRPEQHSAPLEKLNRPTIVFIHGGGFIRGDKSEREHVGNALAKKGFTVVIPNYRLAPEAVWPAGAQDVATLCQWLRAQGSEFKDRPLILVGESAGAAHVASATLCSRFGAMHGFAKYAAVLISGTYHPALEALAAQQLGVMQPDVRNQAYFGSDTGTWDEQSLIKQIDAAPFPLLITYAELDPLQFQVGAGELFAKLVSQHGFTPELHLVRGHNHLSQMFAIGTVDDALSEEINTFAQRLGFA